MRNIRLNFNHPYGIHIDHPSKFVKAILKNQESQLITARWLIALAIDYAMIALAFLLAYEWNWQAYPLSILLLGIAQHRIAILGHDGAHGLISNNKKLNYWLAQILCFWPLLTDIKSYREFHMEHHRHTGNESLDPELHLKQDRYQIPKARKQLYGRFLLDCCGVSIAEFIEVGVYIGRKGNPLWAASFPLLSCLLSFWAGHPEFFVLFMLSKPTTFWAVFRLRVYTEHVGVPGTHRIHLSLWQRLLFAPHNTWMHWEHHNYPQVAFWQLPALRDQRKDVPIINFEDLLFKQESYGKQIQYEMQVPDKIQSRYS